MDPMENFISLSIGLTGFKRGALAPDPDSTDIKSLYLATFRARVTQVNPDDILIRYQIINGHIAGNPPNREERVVELLFAEKPEYEFPCRQLLFLWYAGAWPTVTDTPASTHGQTFSEVISADSYTQGLVWRVMQSHPMGSTTYNYGYWANPPAPLSAYLENPV
ncbi:hypothetical protein [Lysobacter sp. CA196]|uniref:hypothetical protein n=1 Tax=Lysobacter sp. CA196 TaxID=3455606 RepID=UPI003F8D6FE4